MFAQVADGELTLADIFFLIGTCSALVSAVLAGTAKSWVSVFLAIAVGLVALGFFVL